MDQNAESPVSAPITLESLTETPCPVPETKVTLLNLRLKRGTKFFVDADTGGMIRLVLERRAESFEIDFVAATFAELPAATFTTDTVNLDSLTAEEFIARLMANILGETIEATLELKFADDGDETNSVDVSIKSGRYDAHTSVELGDIIHYVGETGQPPVTNK